MADEEDSSPHEHQQEGPPKLKRRRLRGACDACRKRKTKCDSAVRPGSICSNCEIADIHCTHDVPRPPRKKETQQAYIQSLEARLEKMERVLRMLHPEKDIESLLDLPPSVIAESLPSVSTASALKAMPELMYPVPHLASPDLSDGPSPGSVNQESEVDPAEETEDLAHVELAEHLDKLFVEDKRFFGQSSSYMFAHFTMHAKMEAGGSCSSYPLDSRRPVYWEMRPWELSFARSQQNSFVYPEPDLLNSLVALYFEKSNIFIPVLHKPTFVRSLTAGLHLRDSDFGMTVLLVCAIASRFTSDSRVILDDDISSLSSGWTYYSQVPTFRNRLLERSTIYDIQCSVLSTVYLLGTSMIHVAWPMIGLGLRFAQEKGVHRRKGKQKRTVEDELEKRAFWCLIVIDRWMSAFLGRPCGMQDEEFDLDYPVECDDEYWETPDPKDAFQQPPGKPSTITYFIWAIKLVKILGFAHRTLYATKKSKMLIGVMGTEWESQAVNELDSSMNKLKDSLPHFLRWNHEISDNTFFWQSIAFHVCFYHLQIQIHRPFLMKQSSLSLTSLVVCNNAARSMAQVLEAAMSRGAPLFPSFYMSAFSAALVLLLTLWVYQQADSAFEPKATMEFVRKLLHTLKDGERKYHVAGRLCDLTQILGCLSDQRSNPQLKRRRESSDNVDHSDHPISQSQQNYHDPGWEHENLVGPNLQRHVAMTKLGPPALAQANTNTWDIDNFLTPQMGPTTQSSHVQHPSMTSQIDNTFDHLFTQNVNADPSSLFSETNFTAPSSQDAYATDFFVDPHLPAPSFTLDPISSLELDWSGDLLQMWANVPMNFSSNEWQDFLSDAMQPQVPAS